MIRLKDIEQRIELFIRYFITQSSSDSSRHFLTLQSKCKGFDNFPEEKLFYILLATHFDSPYLAIDFHQKMGWKSIQRSDERALRKICNEYFSGKQLRGDQFIGDHRRYIRCLRPTDKADYTVKILVLYKQAVEKYGSQVEFFEVSKPSADFDVLYQRMKDEIACFQPRLPRFDHLEKLSRIYHFYVTPERFYAEDATGPLCGLTLLLFGKRLGKDEGISKEILTETIPAEWNEQIGGEYSIPGGADFKKVVECLERWVITRVRNCRSLQASKRYDKAFVFDLAWKCQPKIDHL